MIQIRHKVITWGGGVNSALYYDPLVPTQANGSTIAANATVLAPAAGTIRNLSVRLLAALGGSDAITVAFNKNGSASGVTVTITDPATSGADTSNEMVLAAGDSFVLFRTGSGFPAAGTAMVSFEWEPDDGDTSIYGFGGSKDQIATSTHRDGLLDGGDGVSGWDGTADQCKTLIGLAGTITAWRIILTTAPGAGDTRTFTIFKNGTAQDGAGGTPDTRITISDTATEGNASFSLSTSSGDYLWVETSHTGTPATTRATGSVAFVSSTAGRWHVGACSTDNYDATATEYYFASGLSDAFSATETNHQFISGQTPYQLGEMIGRLQVAPGSGKSVTFTLRNEQANTVQAITFSDTDTSAATAGAIITIAALTELSIRSLPSGTPTVTNSFPKIAFWGQNVPATVQASFVCGEGGTITSSRTFLGNMDAVTRTVSEPNTFVVGADLFKHMNAATGGVWYGFKEVALTNAEIKALRATPKTLVAAPGTGKVLEFVSAVLLLDYGGTNVFTESADNLAIRYNNGSGVIVSEAIETTGFIDQAADTLTNAIAKADTIAAKSGSEGLALVLHNTGDGEIAGNAGNDNLLRVKVRYVVWSTGW